MNRFNPNPPYQIREAVPGDIPVLVQHHRRMFTEIYQFEGTTINPEAFERMDQVYLQKLTMEIPNRTCIAWVATIPGEIVASGAMSILSLVPLPNDPSLLTGFVHSIFTENRHRKQGAAQAIMETMIDFCRQKRISRIILNASAAGKTLYQKLGFETSPNGMRLLLTP